MTNRKLVSFISCMLAITGCGIQDDNADFSPVSKVVTLMGSQSEFRLSAGNTYPAVALPWGMNFWSPQTGEMGSGWMYTYNSHKIRGFRQTHMPSPWVNDYGQFSLMPVSDIASFDEESRASWFSHQSEKASPHYYQVYLSDHGINAEMTPSDRAVKMRFTYLEGENTGIIVDAFDSGSHIKVCDDGYTVVGFSTSNSGGVPDNFHNWFVIRFDRPVKEYSIYEDGKPVSGNDISGNHVIAALRFGTERGETINVEAASSFISEAQAFRNLEEVEGKTFGQVMQEAVTRWNDLLGRIIVSGNSEERLQTFYSCLYRCVLFPRKFYEIGENGRILHYSPYDGEVHDGYMYTDTGFWDTFRALFPLINLVYPSVGAEIQQGLANTVREGGFLPEWASPGYRNGMIGNNSASVVTDGLLKGLLSMEDAADVYEALKYGSVHVHPACNAVGRRGHEYYNELGYIPYDCGINENTARTLEYAYDDWCISRFAMELGKDTTEINVWKNRSDNFRNVFDPSTKLMRGRNADGSFQEPFNPFKWGDAFTEGNSWHYSWSVFHDIQGLADLMGGDKEFSKMLDSLFVLPPFYDASYYGYRIHEITEMQVAAMGNYAHGNQPAQHVAYLYDYCGQPWKTQSKVRDIMARAYQARPDGYCGDEDNGQTSAWFVFSAMGFYPVCPASDEYAIGSPLFGQCRIRLENGNVIEIDAEGNSDEAVYVHDIRLRGRKWENNYFRYDDLLKGGKIRLRMSDKPNIERGTKTENKPYSASLQF